jgi:CRP-like cAMP-binding protein
MDALINYLLLFGNLNKQQIEFIRSKVVEKEIRKDEFYQQAGQIPKQFVFLVEGIFRISYYNNKGDEITKYFLNENHFVVDLDSYIQNKPSPEYIQAVTDCHYIVLSRDVNERIVGYNRCLG